MQSCIESLSAESLRRLAAELTPEECGRLESLWEFWARPQQLPPAGDWDGWLILAGRGWGKTRVGAEFVRAEAFAKRAKRIALISETSADGRDVMVEGQTGILAACPPGLKPRYEPSKRRLTFRNGAIATLYDAREPDQLRGPQHDLVWFDELAKFRYAERVFDQAMMGLRLGENPHWIATTTPRPIALLRRMMTDSRVVVTRGRTEENANHLAPGFRRAVIERHRGTRLGRQELDAEILEDVPGALWSRSGLDQTRASSLPELMRVVIGVDPAASAGERACETGIIAVGLAANGHAYVLDDWSCRGTPDQWARKAVAALRKWQGDCIVAEANQGGDMVERVIRSASPDAPVRLVRATRGKYVRAEPISALYEQGRVHHAGVFRELEDQMIAFTPESALRGEGERMAVSPDRVDALVWAVTALFPEIVAPERTVPARRDHSAGGWMG